MRLVKMLGLVVVVVFLGGCLTVGSRMMTTQSSGVASIPKVIAFFPLLTAAGPHHGRGAQCPSIAAQNDPADDGAARRR